MTTEQLDKVFQSEKYLNKNQLDFSADASELGWKPGYWPLEFNVTIGIAIFGFERLRPLGIGKGWLYYSPITNRFFSVFND